MYLHLGKKVVVPFKNVIGIFDLDNTTVSKHTRRYSSRNAQKAGCERLGGIAAFVHCLQEGERTVVYISPDIVADVVKNARAIINTEDVI